MYQLPFSAESLTESLVAIDEIATAKFSPEDTAQAKPAVVTARPNDDVTEEELAALGTDLAALFDVCLPIQMKVSLEYPVRVDEDGYPVTNDSQPLLKIRWVIKSNRPLSDTRLNGYSLSADITPEQAAIDTTD